MTKEDPHYEASFSPISRALREYPKEALLHLAPILRGRSPWRVTAQGQRGIAPMQMAHRPDQVGALRELPRLSRRRPLRQKGTRSPHRLETD